ncbi:hypothetical protein A9O67_11435 [Tepidimonas fonticaldi]|uniref:Type II secretion system protein GspC N-terminal domain-containing protein n=1 Tax=Tepidimonas fonticaldi TaxID=1101373 RepID=A0A1A6DY86_9BURK|nr:hypothetical protein [Tepidimonas fonticaldi]OBS31922.1 hypothetical protein A9O67_11435 [Tepidimonas fonticaldi]
MTRWLPLTAARLAALIAAAAALGLAALWLRPAGHATAGPQAWRVWVQDADWGAVLRDPLGAVTLHQPRWVPPAAVAPVLPPPPAPLASAAVGTTAMLERPLFVPNRRPAPPPPPPEAAKPPDPLEGAALVGALVGEHPMAIIRTADGTRRLAVGATVGDWTLRSVDALQAQFARGDETRTIALTVAPLGAPNPNARPAAAAPAPGAAPAAHNLPPNLQAVLERTRREMEERARARAAAGLPPLQ